MKKVKIRMEDKAAFLNKMEKAGQALSTTQIVDNTLENYFEVTLNTPEQLSAVKSIFKQSSGIDKK